jgi:proteasome accessory factor A
VGSEGPFSDERVEFQLSQRADFFEEEVGLETTLKRPLVNTRDEPHADPRRYRRLHVIVGDANLAEVATFLKIGTTSVILAMIEDDFLAGTDLTLADPVRDFRLVSHDLTLQRLLEMADGRRMRALDVQWELYKTARKYAGERGMECVGGEEAGGEILTRWETALHGLETNPEVLDRQLDWVAKRQLLEAYRSRHGLSWTSRKLAAMDLQYHDVRPERSLFARLDMERLTTDEEVDMATKRPPESTRAYFRGRCLAMWASQVTAANWDSLVFDLGVDPLRRVPMMDPLKGTAAHVATLLDRCSNPAELLEHLEA